MDSEEMERWREEQLKRCLLPMQEDISEWILKVFDFSTESLPVRLDADNIYEELSSGEVLCRFANIIINTLRHTVTQRPEVLRKIPGRLVFNASKLQKSSNLSNISSANVTTSSNHSNSVGKKCPLKHMQKMENVHHFLNFCRGLGVLSCSLFESNDLVNYSSSHIKQQKQILICLLSLARHLQRKYNFSNLPELLKLEDDIEEDKLLSNEKRQNTQSQNEMYAFKSMSLTRNAMSYASEGNEVDREEVKAAKVRCNTANNFYRPVSQIPRSVNNRGRSPSLANTRNGLTRDSFINSSNRFSAAEYKKCKGKILDEEIKKVVDSPYFNGRLKFERIAEGKYKLIDDKVIFIRMLRGKHIMVRVGGGWETLQNYLIKHESIISSSFNSNYTYSGIQAQPKNSVGTSSASNSLYSGSSDGNSRLIGGTKSVVVKTVRKVN